VLVGATTVKDTVAHVERYVRGNLGGGLDHLVVFVDAPAADGQREVRELLEAHPHVTCVPAGPGWWGGRRPRVLTERQCTNAGVVRHLLAGTSARWVFHVDGDEVVRLDRGVLDAVPAEVPAVHLTVREAVSRAEPTGEPREFKPLLDPGALERLRRAGLVEEPSNRAWLHGHLMGKAGARASLPVWLGLHRVLDADGYAVPAHEDQRLEVFHYESYSAADFVRKWVAMVASGPLPSFRPGRAAQARRIRGLVDAGLPEAELRARLDEEYRTHVEDDVEALRAHGVLLETDPLAGTHVPDPDPDAVAALRAGLARLRGAPKDAYFVGSSARSR
jgi:hypothetical protein